MITTPADSNANYSNAKPSIVSKLDPSQIKILLIPLSKFPDNSWQNCLKKISEYKKVSLSNFPKQNESESDTIMKKLGGSGCINYNFITSIDPNSKDFIDFQLHQRIFGVIGLIHGEGIDKIAVESGEEAIKKLKENIQNDVSTEIFCIEPVKETSAHENILIINNETDLKNGIDKMTIKIMEIMSNLLKEIHKRPSISSPCGIEDYSGTASRSSTSTGPKMRMKLSGRVQKLLADLHLLTGSFSDAVACYVSATEDAKAANDAIWNAAAQEGFNLALCLQNEQFVNDDRVDIYKTLIDKLTPLSIIYERSGTPILSIDLQITCSRVHRFISQGTQALGILSEAWKSCNLLTFDEKILAYNLVLKELAFAGNWRKWSLYMVQLAQILKAAQKPEIALMTLSKTLSVYNLERSASGGWPAVQSALLKEMVKLSENHSNRLLYFLYGWMYLCHCNRWQDPSDQVQIIETLKKKSMRDMFSLNSKNSGRNNEFVCSLPIFNRIELEEGNDGLFESIDKSLTSGICPFIYNPNSKTPISSSISSSGLLEKFNLIIANEPAKFKLILSNPFLFPIDLKNIHLITDSHLVQQDQFSITLPPLTKNRQISINLTVQCEGKIKILGFCATFMNVEIQFLVNSNGNILEKNEEMAIEFAVIPAQPILKCSSIDLKKGLQIYEGESLEIPLIFSTTSKIPKINFKVLEDQKGSIDLEFEINEIIFGAEKESTFQIGTNLPEQTQKQFEIPLKIFGSFSNLIKTGNLEIFYSSDSGAIENSPKTSVYWRRLIFPLSVTIFPILKVEQFSFFPFSKNFTFSESSILSKYSNFKGIDDCCVGTFIVSNLDSSVNSKILIHVANLPIRNVIVEEIPAQSAKRIFFLMPKLEKTLKMRNVKKLPLNEKQIASVRKLRKPGITDDFLDDTFEDFIYDQDHFWVKKYLIDNLIVNWEIFDDQIRSGKVSLIQCDIPTIYHQSIFKEHLTVQADQSEFKNVRIGQEISISFQVCPEENSTELDYKLKLFPVVVLSDREVGLNFDKVIRYSGCLNSIVRKASSSNPQFRDFKFYSIATATVKIIYQVTEIESGKVHWCKNPIIIDTTELI